MNPGKHIKQVRYRGRNWRTEFMRNERSQGRPGDQGQAFLGKDVEQRGTNPVLADKLNFLQKSGEQLKK